MTGDTLVIVTLILGIGVLAFGMRDTARNPDVYVEIGRQIVEEYRSQHPSAHFVLDVTPEHEAPYEQHMQSVLGIAGLTRARTVVGNEFLGCNFALHRRACRVDREDEALFRFGELEVNGDKGTMRYSVVSAAGTYDGAPPVHVNGGIAVLARDDMGQWTIVDWKPTGVVT